MPMRMRTATGAPGEARVVTSTSAGWSPGDAVGGGFDTSAASDAVPGASASRFPASGRAGEQDPRPAARPQGESGGSDVDDDRVRAGIRDADRPTRSADERHVRRRRGERDGGPGRARARDRRCGCRAENRSRARDHRPTTVNVTVAV